MGRYYYDDPLAAAWMAVHFGMRYQSGQGENIHLNKGMSGRYSFSLHTAQHTDYFGNFYIHPDSLHLLEPQLWDIISSTIEAARYTWLQTPTKIIQRNHVSFIWPKEEV